VTSGLIAQHLLPLQGKDALLEMAKGKLTGLLPASIRPGDVVLFMGAGDIGKTARDVVRRLGGHPVGEHEGVTKE